MPKKSKHHHGKHDFKVNANRHRNEVINKLKYYFDLWSEKNAISLLSEKDLMRLYVMRFTTPRIEPEQGVVINPKILELFKKDLNYLLDLFKVNLKPGLPEISLRDFMTYYITIYSFIDSLPEDDFPNAGLLKEKFKEIMRLNNLTAVKGFSHADPLVIVLAAGFSDPQVAYYTVLIDIKSDISQNKGTHFLFKIRPIKPVSIDFNLPEGKRPAYKLGMPMPGPAVTWVKVKPPESGSVKWNAKLEVYLQPHAILRMYERLELLSNPTIREGLFLSFSVLYKPIYDNNNFLIPYYMGHTVLGYFKADIVDDKILVRTFLFLTNDGTPEARKLKEIAGLHKLDIKYLRLDTLRTFVQSDMNRNPEIKKLFSDAGCGGLFNLQFDAPGAYTGRIQLADKIKKHIGIERQEEETEENKSLP
jgi:hypothetical protein